MLTSRVAENSLAALPSSPSLRSTKSFQKPNTCGYPLLLPAQTLSATALYALRVAARSGLLQPLQALVEGQRTDRDISQAWKALTSLSCSPLFSRREKQKQRRMLMLHFKEGTGHNVRVRAWNTEGQGPKYLEM